MGTRLISLIILLSVSLAWGKEDITYLEKNGKARRLYPISKKTMVFKPGQPAYERAASERAVISADEKYSELYAETRAGGGMLKSLPGGEIVRLKQGINPKRWANQRGLTIEKSLDDHTILVSGVSGRAALDQHELIIEDAGVESAEPNFLFNVEPRKIPRLIQPAVRNSPQR